jgi:hypothetical protein
LILKHRFLNQATFFLLIVLLSAGFVPVSRLIQIRSEVPVPVSIALGLPPVRSSAYVTDSSTLIDPERARTAYTVGQKILDQQMPAQLGRDMTDAVNSEPGWLYEANGVLHPRGSECEVQFVVNSLPTTENRSPAFAPSLVSGNAQSMRVMTAGFPAEYGRKLGGIVEVTTTKELPAGFDLYLKESRTVTLQIQGSNLTNHLNMINFASLLSGLRLELPAVSASG